MGGSLSVKGFVGKKVLLLCHENADLDSFCAAKIFQDFLKKNKIKSVIGIPSHINEQTKAFAEKEKIFYEVGPVLEKFDIFCLFDFNDYEQLGALRKDFLKIEKEKKTIAFDHHEKEKRSIAEGFIDPKKLSTTELLFDIIGKNFDKKMCYCACLGMIEDTGRFLVGNSNFFEAFAICLKKSGKTYGEVFGVAKHNPPEGERIAFLKAAQRARINKFGEAIVVTSNLSFFQGAAATKLLGFGADISIVCGTDKKGITHLSARADTYFNQKNNFNLMKDLLIKLEEKVGGDVGGHSGAAQWKGKGKEKIVMKECLKILEKKFGNVKKF